MSVGEKRPGRDVAGEGTQKVGRREILLVGVVTLGAFVALLNQTVMSPALPQIMRAFDVGAGTAQWVTSVYMLVSGIMVPVSAFLMDKFSTRRLFFGAMGAFAAGTVLAAVAPCFGVLLAGRVLQAAASGVLLPMVATVPMLVFPPERRGTAMGVAGIVMAAGPAVGPVVGGAIIDALGWRAMFWSIVPLVVLICALAVPFLSNVGTLRDPSFDVLSVALSTVAFGGLLLGFSNASTLGWASVGVIAPAVFGAVALVAFVVRQRRLDEPMLRLGVLSNRRFAASAVLVTLINAATAATNVTLPIFLQNALGVSALETGMAMLPAAVIGLLLSPVSGVVFDRCGARGIGIAGLALMTASLFALSRVGTGTSVVLVAVLCMLQAAGQGLANMPINTWGVNALPDAEIAHGNAIANTGRQVMGAIATAVIVTVMTSVQASSAALGIQAATAAGVGASYLACAAVSAVALVVCVLTVRGEHVRA